MVPLTEEETNLASKVAAFVSTVKAGGYPSVSRNQWPALARAGAAELLGSDPDMIISERDSRILARAEQMVREFNTLTTKFKEPR